jgi:hypothetical protein
MTSKPVRVDMLASSEITSEMTGSFATGEGVRHRSSRDELVIVQSILGWRGGSRTNGRLLKCSANLSSLT